MAAVLLEHTYPGVTYCGSHKEKLPIGMRNIWGKSSRSVHMVGVSSRSNYRVNNLDSTVVSSCFVTCVNESLNTLSGWFVSNIHTF